MARFRWSVVMLVICLPVAWLALGLQIPGWSEGERAKPSRVGAGEIELAWMHTSTNGTTWERFVTGLVRLQAENPNLQVDDSRAYADAPGQAPEVVLRAESLVVRIRWYKLTSQIQHTDWVRALAARDPAPMAFIGGGSSDRAADLARALANQPSWRGEKPLLFITTATADETTDRQPLVSIHKASTFRFCFTNKQMANAVVDFAWKNPTLFPPDSKPLVCSVTWEDDPFSADLHNHFSEALKKEGAEPKRFSVRHSIGGISTPNATEAKCVEEILQATRAEPTRPVTLILCSVTQTSRRVLKALLEREPSLRQRLVVLTGDGIPVNALLRDGEFAWPVHSLPVPLVLFTHNNPVAWDGPDSKVSVEYRLNLPNSTEDVLHFTEIGKILTRAILSGQGPEGADELRNRLRRLQPTLFTEEGERKAATGEYVVLFRPDSKLEVYRRDGENWPRSSRWAINQQSREASMIPEGSR
ncbi:MAG: hypothetical protein ACRC8S_01355 [Fimbriiglobus sp.]